MPDAAPLGTPMSGDDHELLVVEDQPAKSKKKQLSIDRVRATIDRVIQNRMRKMDRYNGISIFRAPREDGQVKKVNDAKVLPGDTPDIQCLFRLKTLFEEAGGVEDLEKRIRLQDSIADKIIKLCDRLEEQNGKIVQELQELSESDRKEREAEGLSPDDLYRLAATAKPA